MNHLPPLIILLHVSICTSSPRFMLHMSMYSCRCLFMSLLAVANSSVCEREDTITSNMCQKRQEVQIHHSVGRVDLDLSDCLLIFLLSGLEKRIGLVEEISQTGVLRKKSHNGGFQYSQTVRTDNKKEMKEMYYPATFLNWFLFKVNGVLLNFAFNQKWQQYEAVQPFSTSIIIRNVSWANQNIRMIMWH